MFNKGDIVKVICTYDCCNPKAGKFPSRYKNEDATVLDTGNPGTYRLLFGDGRTWHADEVALLLITRAEKESPLQKYKVGDRIVMTDSANRAYSQTRAGKVGTIKAHEGGNTYIVFFDAPLSQTYPVSSLHFTHVVPEVKEVKVMNVDKLGAIRDVQEVIDRHGLDAVKYCLEFIANYPAKITNVATLYNPNSDNLNIPADKYDYIKGLVTTGNKIQAIKLIRELTRCGLKEAKDVVEYESNWR